jgi:futalosine hydrolase
MLGPVSVLIAYPSMREGEWDAANGVETLELGVGKTSAAATLAGRLVQGPPVGVVILVGVCGAFPRAHLQNPTMAREILELCVVTREGFGDEGVETPAGFLTMEDLGFGGSVPLSACEHRSKKIAERLGAHLAVGLTVSSCSGTDARSVERGRLGAAVESMEGASVAHVCGVHNVPWVQLRCVSNYTGDRTADAWRLDEALAKLAQAATLVTHMEDLV